MTFALKRGKEDKFNNNKGEQSKNVAKTHFSWTILGILYFLTWGIAFRCFESYLLRLIVYLNMFSVDLKCRDDFLFY
jgi:hypothetical protein